jgi:hypothetical protein
VQVAEKYRRLIKTEKVKFGVEAGANKGGIVENTDLSKVENAPVDGFTGATSMGFHAGGHAVIPVGRNDVQAGLNYLYSPQKFTYNDAVNGYFGTRKISLSQLVVPVTYNINLFKRTLDPGTLSIKLGGVIEYNMPSILDDGSLLTDYSIKKLSGGITLGISTMPFRFSDQSGLGLSFDVYKGTQIFDDFYNRPEFEMPTSSYMKLSIIYQFK